MNTLVRGQKLPIFSGSGLPHDQVAAQIVRQAALPGRGERIRRGLCRHRRQRTMSRSSSREACRRAARFPPACCSSISPDDPSVERLITPRAALTLAEFLAFDEGMHVLVVLTD